MPELLVVGGIDSVTFFRYGDYDPVKGLPHVYAPGHTVKAADWNKNNWAFSPLKDTKGTSTCKQLPSIETVHLLANSHSISCSDHRGSCGLLLETSTGGKALN